MTFKVGITGGIGSGKSTVAQVFSTLGVPVYYADDAAKHIMNVNPEVKQAIVGIFGEDVYEGGTLQRKVLSSKVFNDKNKLAQLNAIVHPATIRFGNEWLARQTYPYAIKEAALLFETGTAAQLNFIIGVYAPDALRIHRVMERDNVSRELVKQRMEKQIQEQIKMRLCDAVIVNNDQEMVIPQVLALHEQLLERAKAKDQTT
ncbi:dephospho-CoA kinase [Parasegetibacter sp. NRK P23]|uniref:dephospho-CoA kinase n=1 Tax=Parasegetibacter sp. NRK P23 TaxID=2942999 RepID=UPI00204456E4|nr:dephospho-CoA kinase [Parasegetibacter sp. NRK P23]MCM5528165.1 dephospho-CoA kinase [Parasegetibacter sp. NRK P23]